jgi:hypothetical protein
MNFYEDPPYSRKNRLLQQGDILCRIPFVGLVATRAEILLPDSRATIIKDLTSTPAPESGTSVCCNFQLSNAIVLTQTCDLNQTKANWILVAAVKPWETILKAAEDPKKWPGMIKVLANPGKTPAWFYLPEHKSQDFHLPRSLAVFYQIQCLNRDDMESIGKECFCLRLSSVALQALQERLSYFFGRFGAPDDLYE